jgi:antitoxin YefM
MKRMHIIIDKAESVHNNVRIRRCAKMLNINATNFRKNVFRILEQTIKYNEPVNISTKDGNAVIISEEDYNGMVETIYLTSIPGMKEKLIEGMNTPVSDCVPYDEVEM